MPVPIQTTPSPPVVGATVAVPPALKPVARLYLMMTFTLLSALPFWRTYSRAPAPPGSRMRTQALARAKLPIAVPVPVVIRSLAEVVPLVPVPLARTLQPASLRVSLIVNKARPLVLFAGTFVVPT